MKTMKMLIFQCGECSNIWNSIGEISDHMNKHHNKDNIEKKDADAEIQISEVCTLTRSN